MILSFYESVRFHFYHAWFNIREQFSDLPSALAAQSLVPFFVWILTQTWKRFNLAQGNFKISEVVFYICITEILFLTFLRAGSLSRASGDFSISLARPRSWLWMSFSGLIGRSLGARLLMFIIFFIVFPFSGASPSEFIHILFRFILILPWLVVLQGLFALFFSTCQVQWHQTNYFLMPFSKIFLVIGGVWGPIADFSEPWRSWVLLFPSSDLFFQPAYFCVKGVFYKMTPEVWIFKTSFLALFVLLITLLFFARAKKHHQAFGG